MIQQDIFISPLCPIPKLKKSQYKIPDIFPPLLLLNEQINQRIKEAKVKSLNLSLSSTNSETEEDGEDCSCESERERTFKTFNSEKEESIDALNIRLQSKKNSGIKEFKDIKREKGYTILDILKLTCK